jgi:hypothetical protein
MKIRTHIAALLLTLLLTSGCDTQPTQPTQPAQSAQPTPKSTPETVPAVCLIRTIRYQPDEVLKQRLVEEKLPSYLGSLLKETDAFFSAMPRGEPHSAEFLVAIRTNGQVKCWYEYSGKAINSNQMAILRARLEKVSPPAIQGGPVAVGLQVSVWGGPPPPKDVYLPREWHDAIKKNSSSVMVPDGVLPLVWPEK